MKVIDLLNKIANGEIEIGCTIKHDGALYRYSEGDFVETNDLGAPSGNWLFANEVIDLRNLNDEVEILEEEKKIEELKVLPYEKCIHEVTHKEKEILLEIRDLQIAFNEIIGVINNVKHRRD